MTSVTLPFTLEELRQLCVSTTKLDLKIASMLEAALGGKYHGHKTLEFGIVTIFLNLPKSCMSKANRTTLVNQLFGDDSVSCAYLDFDQDENPLSLDIIPRMVITRL